MPWGEESDDAVYPGHASGDDPLRSAYFVPVSELYTRNFTLVGGALLDVGGQIWSSQLLQEIKAGFLRWCPPSYILKG